MLSDDQLKELSAAAGALPNRPPMAVATAIFTGAATELKVGVQHQDSDRLFQAVLGPLRNVDDLRHTSRTAEIPKPHLRMQLVRGSQQP